jgi:hypothetical protein
VEELALTVIVTSSVDERTLSLAVSLKTYVPSIEKLAEVLSALASPNVTVPGPLTLDQVVVTVAGGLGNPSSVALPLSDALDGKVIAWSPPALTTGARLRLNGAPSTQFQLLPVIAPVAAGAIESPAVVFIPSFNPHRATSPLPLVNS